MSLLEIELGLVLHLLGQVPTTDFVCQFPLISRDGLEKSKSRAEVKRLQDSAAVSLLGYP